MNEQLYVMNVNEYGYITCIRILVLRGGAIRHLRRVLRHAALLNESPLPLCRERWSTSRRNFQSLAVTTPACGSPTIR